MLPKARAPKCAIVRMVFARSIRSRIFWKDERNIQLCIVTIALWPESFASVKLRSMKQAKRSLLASGKRFLANLYTRAFIPLLPIYGGLATTASYCAASISACRTSGPKRLSASDTKRPGLVASLSFFSAGNFTANSSGTWISEPKVVACSNSRFNSVRSSARSP